MKAIVQDRYGLPESLELREVAEPTMGADEVLVRVRAASVHPDVWHLVSGRPYAIRVMGTGFDRPKDRIPGTDMAGVVERVGSRVTRFVTGDEVFGETIEAQTWTNGGAYAERVSVNEDLLALKPDNVSFEEAASVPTSGYIALSNLRGAKEALPGRRVLVNGAGGGVGMLALQITKAYGAHVTGVDTTSKLEMLRALGADEVVDFTKENFTTRGARYALIFDVPGNYSFSECRRALDPDGRYVLIGHELFGASGKRVLGIIPYFFKLMFLARFVKQLRGPGVPLPTRRAAMEELRELLESRRLTPLIDSTYPLSQAGAALRHLVDNETHGKVMLTVSNGGVTRVGP